MKDELLPVHKLIDVKDDRTTLIQAFVMLPLFTILKQQLTSAFTWVIIIHLVTLLLLLLDALLTSCRRCHQHLYNIEQYFSLCMMGVNPPIPLSKA